MPGVGELVGRLTSDELGGRERRRALLDLTRALAGSVGDARRWLVDLLVDEVAPQLPVRDLLTLREQHGGLSGDALADVLVARASKLTAAVGAAAGALSAADVVAPALLLASPLELVAGTLAVIAVEVKLVAELHVVYGRAVSGSRSQVAVAYVVAWALRQPADGSGRAPALSSVLGAATRQRIRQRVVRRLGRNVTTLVPFLAGALVGAEVNRRETRALGAALMRSFHPRS